MLSILNKKKLGQQVIEYVRVEKSISKTQQENMMKLLYDSVTANVDSPY